MLLTFLNTLATIISVISLLIVTYGVLVGFVAFLRNEIKRFNGTYTINNIRQLRADFGSYLLLGLEFLIASDILKTVVDPTLDELAILGGVVVVRTVLSVFLNKEIKELAEHNMQFHNELTSYQRRQLGVDIVLRKHTSYKLSPLYKKLEADIERFLKHI